MFVRNPRFSARATAHDKGRVVPTASALQAWREVEDAYKRSVRTSFTTISPQPVASASLGQVRAHQQPCG